MPSRTSHWLDVPGARLYFEVQGSGPVLMLVGHPMGAVGFAAIAAILAADYTVVTFDPRGFDRSAIDDREQDADPDMLADDAWRVLDAVGGRPIDVFGSSGGAVTGLALVARHPEHIRTLVAHEPPLALLLPDAEQARAGMHDIYDTFRQNGIAAAWRRFATFTGLSVTPPGGCASSSAGDQSAEATSERFFAHGLFPIAFYQPDFPALQDASSRVVVAGGSTSEGEFAHRTASMLAERLGTDLIIFPGGHGGFASDPGDFAAVLRRILT